jgi:hypothetical protein
MSREIILTPKAKDTLLSIVLFIRGNRQEPINTNENLPLKS